MNTNKPHTPSRQGPARLLPVIVAAMVALSAAAVTPVMATADETGDAGETIRTVTSDTGPADPVGAYDMKPVTLDLSADPADEGSPSDEAGVESDGAAESLSLTLHDQKPRTAEFDFYAPTGGYGTAEKIHSVTIDGEESITLPTADELASLAGGEAILHPETHQGQGFSGNADWEFVGWSILTTDDEYSTLQDDGSVVTTSDFDDPNQDPDLFYWEPGRTYTPPTAGTLTSDNPDSVDIWWNMHGDFVPVYKPLIRYHANGGTGTMESSASNITAQNKFTAPSRKEFSGWNTRSDNSGDTYNQLQIVMLAPTTLGALRNIHPDYGVDEAAVPYQPLLLYAQWNQYGSASYAARVIYDGLWSYRDDKPNGRLSAPEAVNKAIDEYMKADSWQVTGYISSEDNKPFDTELPKLEKEYKYGMWVSDFDVNYLVNDKWTVVPLSDAIGDRFTLTWNTEPDGSGTTYQPTTMFHVPLGVTYLYAQFTPKTPDAVPDVTISYRANGGEGTVGDETVELGDDTNIARNGFSFHSHRFIGWNTEPDGSGTSYAPGQSIAPTEDLVLYAQWETSILPADGLPGTGGAVSPAAMIVAVSALLITLAVIALIIAHRQGIRHDTSGRRQA